MTKQRLKDIRYLKMVRIWATNSYAIRLKVGCLIVSKDGNIISDGYNGTPRGFENVCEYSDKKEYEPFDHLADEETAPDFDSVVVVYVPAGENEPCAYKVG